ncbi:TIGR00730 family Rossman fold protein [Geomonas subterranea]|uniref:Cytokinin riboside 5'-monophosphate phosphoribohydrolase n=1 Tax=Geomonas subterranea TaxID=2847989 RepID=A0ABX8LPX0_9BACT|nr:TIGR00730 family Rossman fold protein [Geomonas subterranea]QXE92639.1 TIGR00730 family Rossman fold protein [Geomonas subterranea]QXM09262.1 TIGR00730 family Rossman fold protein [Geomonas subterranea]
MKRICVFCGSSPGMRPAYVDAARELGRSLVHADMELVYGGGGVGLMGALAQSVLDAGGRVTGVIPRLLVEKELAHKHLSELHIVESMHQRKALMAQLADGFIALPGGIGTLEELVEILTWSQLGIHHKACGLLNIEGYYDRFLGFFSHMIEEQFAPPATIETLAVSAEPAELLQAMSRFQQPHLDKVGWALGFADT